jgi:hypothetical protein
MQPRKQIYVFLIAITETLSRLIICGMQLPKAHKNTPLSLASGMFFSHFPSSKSNYYMILAMLMRLAFDGAGLGKVVGFGGERSLGPSWTRFTGL